MQWEYKTVKLEATGGFLKNKVDESAFDAALNQLGKERWELVSTFVEGGELTPDIVALFKRPMQSGRDVSEVRGVCPKCGYDLRGTPHDACPECGWQARVGS